MDGFSFRFATPLVLALIPALGLLLWGQARRMRGSMAAMRYSDVRAVATIGTGARRLSA